MEKSAAAARRRQKQGRREGLGDVIRWGTSNNGVTSNNRVTSNYRGTSNNRDTGNRGGKSDSRHASDSKGTSDGILMPASTNKCNNNSEQPLKCRFFVDWIISSFIMLRGKKLLEFLFVTYSYAKYSLRENVVQ
jgi:hypothetical protein